MFSCTYVWYVMSCTQLVVLGLRSAARRGAAATRLRGSVALLGELLDRVAAVAENALVAVDERDRALARRGVHEGGIVRHQPEFVGRRLDLAKVHRAGRRVAFDAALQDLNGVGLVGAGILDVERSRCAKLTRRWRRLRVPHAHDLPERSRRSKFAPSQVSGNLSATRNGAKRQRTVDGDNALVLVRRRVPARSVRQRWRAPERSASTRAVNRCASEIRSTSTAVESTPFSSRARRSSDVVETPGDFHRGQRLLRATPDERDDDAGKAPDRSHARR